MEFIEACATYYNFLTELMHWQERYYYILHGLMHIVMVTETSTETRTQLSISEYVESLRKLGGEAPTKDFAEEVGRDTTTVNRRFKNCNENENIPVERVMVGDCYLYRYTGAGDEAQEAEDE